MDDFCLFLFYAVCVGDCLGVKCSDWVLVLSVDYGVIPITNS